MQTVKNLDRDQVNELIKKGDVLLVNPALNLIICVRAEPVEAFGRSFPYGKPFMQFVAIFVTIKYTQYVTILKNKGFHMSKLLRINDSTIAQLESLSKLTGDSKQKIMDRAVKLYAYEQILKKANEQYATLRDNPKAWQELEDERKEWDDTLTDGLSDD